MGKTSVVTKGYYEYINIAELWGYTPLEVVLAREDHCAPSYATVPSETSPNNVPEKKRGVCVLCTGCGRLTSVSEMNLGRVGQHAPVLQVYVPRTCFLYRPLS